MTTAAAAMPNARRGTIPVFAAATAVTVSNIYFTQPLLEQIARSFHISAAAAGLVATAGQIGYALGIVAIVPLADGAKLRRLSAVLLTVTTLALVAGAFAPSITLLSLAALILSATTVIPQVIMPTAVAMAAKGQAGRVLGAIGTALTLGALVSRSVSGVLAEITGTWRAGFLFSALATAAMLLILPRYMPAKAGQGTGETLGYRRLLRSLPALFPRYPALRISAALGGLVFAAFSGFWAVLAFHLTEQPIGLGAAAVGLFGIAAVPGALGARYSGRMADRWGPTVVNAASLTAVALALALFLIAGDSLVALFIGVNLLGFGTTSGQIANQVRVFTAGPEVRARINTLYMFSVFAGGATGTAVAGALFAAYGWSGAIGGGFGFLGLAMVVLALHAARTRREPAGSALADDSVSLPGAGVPSDSVSLSGTRSPGDRVRAGVGSEGSSGR
ncbi:MFS transporter [Streptomyces sp. NPDC057428]|uniref:MFS transporter n=1 Tax=Streptomyces sp. NPDC057428 TaxID=3346129 RepID=UPI0036C2B1BB